MSASPNPPMSAAHPPMPAPRDRSRKGVLWLLFLGLTVALAGNLYQFVEIEHLSRDMTLTQRSNDRQFGELKDGISGVLEQSLLRYEELNKEMEGSKTASLREAASEAKKRNEDLAKAEVSRHEEQLKQLTDLRSDLRQDTAAKLSQISQNVETERSEVRHVASDLDTVKGEMEHNAQPAAPKPVVATVKPAPAPQAAPAPKKKRFWSRLNPFRGKKKTETADSGAGDPSATAAASSR